MVHSKGFYSLTNEKFEYHTLWAKTTWRGRKIQTSTKRLINTLPPSFSFPSPLPPKPSKLHWLMSLITKAQYLCSSLNLLENVSLFPLRVFARLNSLSESLICVAPTSIIGNALLLLYPWSVRTGQFCHNMDTLLQTKTSMYFYSGDCGPLELFKKSFCKIMFKKLSKKLKPWLQLFK